MLFNTPTQTPLLLISLLATIYLDTFAFVWQVDYEQMAKKICLTVVDVFELFVLQLQSSSSSLAPEHHDHGGDEDDCDEDEDRE